MQLERRQSGGAGLWLAYSAFVVYGSLVPLDFHPLPFGQVWQAFSNAPFLDLGVESRADWIANGVLYVPVGLLGARALGRGRPGLFAALASLILASLLAFVVEFAQVCFPPRTVSQNDLLAECLGSLVGVLFAPRIGSWIDRLRSAWSVDGARLQAILLPAYALAYVLFCLSRNSCCEIRMSYGKKQNST